MATARTSRKSAVLVFSARTTIAEAMSIYLHHNGEIADGTDNHAVDVGVRFS